MVDEFGAIIDGHNRVRACRQLGINDYPTDVRSGLSESEKRALARQLNMLRRHLSREQIRALIADQLAETPDWSDRRIGRQLGVDHKTVGAVRSGRPLKPKPAGEIPQVAPFAQTPEQRAKLAHALGLIQMGADPGSDEVARLLIEASSGVIESPGYNPFAHCDAAGERAWHLFILFLTSHCAWPVDGAAQHVEHLLQKQFKTPDDWLGPDGAAYRRRCFLPELESEPSDQFKAHWAAFVQAHAGDTQATIMAAAERSLILGSLELDGRILTVTAGALVQIPIARRAGKKRKAWIVQSRGFALRDCLGGAGAVEALYLSLSKRDGYWIAELDSAQRQLIAGYDNGAADRLTRGATELQFRQQSDRPLCGCDDAPLVRPAPAV